MTRILRLVLIVASVLGCSEGVANRPGSPLEGVARAALNCPVGTITWSLDEGAEAGVIDQGGFYTAPACRPDFPDATYHVRATGCGGSVSIPVQVGDNVKEVQMICGRVLPEACCRVSPVVSPGAQIQWYAAVVYNCAGHIVYTQIPPAICP